MVKSRVLKLQKIKWQELTFLQDENFKEWIDGGDQKLLQSILKYQFIDPFKVWEHDGKLYCLDGKHRVLDLTKVKASGVEVPDELDATFIDCRDRSEAAELVLVYSSAYAKVTQQGLFDFVEKFNLDIPDLKGIIAIPDFSIERFEQNFDVYNIDEEEEPLPDEIEESDIIVKPGD